MTRNEGDPSSAKGNFFLGIAEVYTDPKKGEELATAAQEFDWDLRRDWLDREFGFSFGPRRNDPFVRYETKDPSVLGCVMADAGPLVEAYQRETLGRALTMLGHDFSSQIKLPPYGGHNHEPFATSGTGALEVNETAGYDWLDSENYGYKASIFITGLPAMINTPEVTELVREQTEFIDMGIEGRPIQQFTGTIVRLPGYVCQFIKAFETHAVPPEVDQQFPDTVAVRAWRTDSNS